MNIQNRNLVLVTCLIGALTTGCLDFGRDTELVAPHVSAQHLQEVTKLTGIVFPAGSTGLAYLYEGSGIDPSLAVKVQLPAEKKEEFLENRIFRTGSEVAPQAQIGKSKPWWHLDKLAERINRTTNSPGSGYVECTLGMENGELIVYISWFTTCLASPKQLQAVTALITSEHIPTEADGILRELGVGDQTNEIARAASFILKRRAALKVEARPR